ncbi:MAG TPA: hypothetical protein VE736_07805 [Gaiellaceae bacterium]|jgi:hypothetical protein|nr:hypothetical protein [Gaiellaceae bacterium]
MPLPAATTNLLIIIGPILLFAGMYLACYTIWIATWEGWESWHARTGLDGDRAEQEAARRRQM